MELQASIFVIFKVLFSSCEGNQNQYIVIISWVMFTAGKKISVNDHFVYATFTQTQHGINDKPFVLQYNLFSHFDNLVLVHNFFYLVCIMSVVYSTQDPQFVFLLYFADTLLSFLILKSNFSLCNYLVVSNKIEIIYLVSYCDKCYVKHYVLVFISTSIVNLQFYCCIY